jgi:hypothetical protein
MKPEALIIRGLLAIAGLSLLLAMLMFLRTGALAEAALRLPDTIVAGLLGYLAREIQAHPPAPKEDEE